MEIQRGLPDGAAPPALGYGAINIPEHIVMPDNLVENMGSHWPARSRRWRSSPARRRASG
jgi:hypothetical protein